MNEIDKLRDIELTNKAIDCLRSLLQSQVDSMEPLTVAKRRIARQGLAAIYVSVAGGLHAQELGKPKEVLAQNSETAQKFSEMRKKLEH